MQMRRHRLGAWMSANGIQCQGCGQRVPITPEDLPLYCSCGFVTVSRSSDDMTPGFWRRAGAFGKAVARHTLNGLQKTPHDEKQTRALICSGCEFKHGSRCGKCGCQIEGWPNKLDWASERCPIGKWEAVKKK